MNAKAEKIVELMKKDIENFDFDTKVDYLADILDWAEKQHMDAWDAETEEE